MNETETQFGTHKTKANFVTWSFPNSQSGRDDLCMTSFYTHQANFDVHSTITLSNRRRVCSTINYQPSTHRITQKVQVIILITSTVNSYLLSMSSNTDPTEAREVSSAIAESPSPSLTIETTKRDEVNVDDSVDREKLSKNQLKKRRRIEKAREAHKRVS